AAGLAAAFGALAFGALRLVAELFFAVLRLGAAFLLVDFLAAARFAGVRFLAVDFFLPPDRVAVDRLAVTLFLVEDFFFAGIFPPFGCAMQTRALVHADEDPRLLPAFYSIGSPQRQALPASLR